MGRRNHFFKRNQITLVILMVFLAYVSVTLVRQEIVLREVQYEEAEKLAEIEQLTTEVEKLEERIEEADDMAYIEKIAREKLKMVKSNEIIYIIQDEKE